MAVVSRRAQHVTITPHFRYTSQADDHFLVWLLQESSDFSDDQVSLPTLLPANNLTVMFDDTNSTDTIFVVSYGSEAEVITPPMYACNVSS